MCTNTRTSRETATTTTARQQDGTATRKDIVAIFNQACAWDYPRKDLFITKTPNGGSVAATLRCSLAAIGKHAGHPPARGCAACIVSGATLLRRPCARKRVVHHSGCLRRASSRMGDRALAKAARKEGKEQKGPEASKEAWGEEAPPLYCLTATLARHHSSGTRPIGSSFADWTYALPIP